MLMNAASQELVQQTLSVKTSTVASTVNAMMDTQRMAKTVRVSKLNSFTLMMSLHCFSHCKLLNKAQKHLSTVWCEEKHLESYN